MNEKIENSIGPLIDEEKLNKTQEWLQSQKKHTAAAYKNYWRYFIEFLNKNPTGYMIENKILEATGETILEERKTDTGHQFERKVLEFKAWMREVKKFADYTATTAAMAIRSFFAFHYVELKYRKTERERLRERTRKTEDYRFTKGDLYKMFITGNLVERYIVSAGKSFGLRAGDFVKLTRGDLEPYLNREPPISIGEYNTEKRGVTAYPFIDPDALPIIKAMISKMDKEGRTNPTDRILSYASDTELSRILRNLAAKSGIVPGSKRIRFHGMRKFLIDHLSSVMSESKWKQIVGKVIAEGAYVSADSLRDDYSKVLPETCFATVQSDVQKIANKEALETMLKMFGLTPGDIRDMYKARKTKTLDEEIAILEEESGKRSPAAGGLAFRQTATEEIAKMLLDAIRMVKEKQ